jgi:tRNA(Ile)-lysidine synthase
MKPVLKKKAQSQAFHLDCIFHDFLLENIAFEQERPGILVAVSGGADSIALLGAAQELAKAKFIIVHAAHFIHHPDSIEAQARASLVAAVCRAQDIELSVGVLGKNRLGPGSPEERLRRARYLFLEETARQQGCDWIVTGHHADDQAETVLLRALVGTGLKGLAGIPGKRGMILRPFLNVGKERLVDYCRTQNISFAEDPANTDLHIPRNFIRHEILPRIKDGINPEVRASLVRLSRWAGEANEVVDAEVENCWQKALRIFQKGKIVLDIDAILPYFNMIQKYTLLKALQELAGCDLPLQGHDLDRLVDFMHRSRTGSMLEFPDELRVVKHRRELLFTAGKMRTFSCRLFPGQEQELAEFECVITWEKTPGENFEVGDAEVADLALGQNAGELTLRYAQEGDRFRPLGAPGEKRLFRFLTDRRVSRFEKRNTLVLVQNGEIIWVVGHRISEKARIREKTAAGNWRVTLKFSCLSLY